MFASLSLFVLTEVRAADDLYPCDTHTNDACMQQYNNATAVCAAQETGTAMPSGDLHNFGEQMGKMVEIVSVGTHDMRPLSDKPMPYETWFTRQEENVQYLASAIGDLPITNHSDDEVKNMIIERISAALGMQSEGEKCVINVGTTEVKQMDPSGSENIGGFFRPCWNSADITNTECEYVDPSKQVPYVKAHAKDSFNMTSPDEFPFVGMGYTFDWMKWENNGKASKAAIGMNEFVILPNRGTLVHWHKMCSPLAYFCEICGKGQNCGTFNQFATQHCDSIAPCETAGSTTSTTPSLVLV
jgi:hypothetical protein